MTVFWWWPMTDSGESPKYCKLLVSPRSGSLEPASLANSTMSLEMNHPQLAELFMLVNCDIIYPYRWKPTLYVTIGVIAAHLSQTRQEQVSDWKQSPPTSPGKFPISIWANIFGNAHVCLCMNYIYMCVCVGDCGCVYVWYIFKYRKSSLCWSKNHVIPSRGNILLALAHLDLWNPKKIWWSNGHQKRVPNNQSWFITPITRFYKPTFLWLDSFMIHL